VSTGPAGARRPIGVGVVGLGFMGRTHLRAYAAAAAAGHACALVAVADRDAARLEGRDVVRGNLETGGTGAPLFDPSLVRVTCEAAELLADPRVELVSVCTPTDSHVPLALAALEAGKHVIVEKPVALRAAEVESLAAAAAARPHRLALPAFCMRFWPGWDWLIETVRARTFGAVRSARFERLAGPPSWGLDFYTDPARSGGALFDMHVHDADLVCACFGPPRAVASTGTIDHVTTAYAFGDTPPHVVAEGGWDLVGGRPFGMRYTVAFERATAEYVLGREPPLVLYEGGEAHAVPLAATTGYDGEIRHALDVVAGAAAPYVTLADALAVTRVLEAEARSLRTGARVALDA